MKHVTKVARVATWEGWCTPCERDDRPLILTRSGPAGLLAWLTGHGDDDRCLLLTCRVCGEWQVVPRREADDPDVMLVDDLEDAVEAVTAILTEARLPAPVAAPVPVAPLDRTRRRPSGPTPRRPERAVVAVRVPRPRAGAVPSAPTSIALPSNTVLDLLASGHQVVLAAG